MMKFVMSLVLGMFLLSSPSQAFWWFHGKSCHTHTPKGYHCHKKRHHKNREEAPAPTSEELVEEPAQFYDSSEYGRGGLEGEPIEPLEDVVPEDKPTIKPLNEIIEDIRRGVEELE